MPFRHWPWWLKTVAISLAAFVLVWGLWMALRDTLCSVDTEDWVLKRPTRGACFEFWANRYQGAWSALVGATAALLAAAVAWVAVQRQIREARRQLSIAQWQAIIASRKDLLLDRQLIGDASAMLTTMLDRYRTLKPIEFVSEVGEFLQKMADSAGDKVTQANSIGAAWGRDTDVVRGRILIQLREVSLACSEMRSELAAQRQAMALAGSSAFPQSPKHQTLGAAVSGALVRHNRDKDRFLELSSKDVKRVDYLCGKLGAAVFRDHNDDVSQ